MKDVREMVMMKIILEEVAEAAEVALEAPEAAEAAIEAAVIDPKLKEVEAVVV